MSESIVDWSIELTKQRDIPDDLKYRYRQLSWGDIGYGYGCKECGALVIDTTIHDKWHQETEQ
jgi:hypothetical protein